MYRSFLVVGSYNFVETGIEAKLLFEGLDKMFGNSKSIFNVSIKVFCDLFVYNLIETSTFLTWCNVLEGQDDTVKEKFSRDLGLMMLIGYCYWIPISIIQFGLVPLKYRSLFACATSFVDDLYIMYASHNNLREKVNSILGN